MSDFNKDILPKIKQIDDNLGRLRLKKITLRKSGSAEFDFICDKSVIRQKFSGEQYALSAETGKNYLRRFHYFASSGYLSLYTPNG